MNTPTKTATLFTLLVFLGIVAQAVCAGESYPYTVPDLSKLTVEPENRCAPYDAKQYRYPATLDRKWLEGRGYTVDASGLVNKTVPSPYTPGIRFRFVQDMDIEHLVARSEAHDSGLCSRPDEWTPFASDMDNITIAGEHVNRTMKRDKDPAGWLPMRNQCWYVEQWVKVKLKYGLTVDEEERDALASALTDCG